MQGLRRHRLVRLHAAGWSAILQRAWDAQARAPVEHWALHGLPLVVTRQPPDYAASGTLALGLPAASAWGKLRIAVQVPTSAVRGLDEFPRLGEVLGLLPADAQELLQALDACGVMARVFGSYGWQAISGLPYLRAESDLDLCIGVEDIAQADAVAALLQAHSWAGPRLDGELMFGDGASVAWREWAAWRAGRARAVMVKHLDRIALEQGTEWCTPPALQEAAP